MRPPPENNRPDCFACSNSSRILAKSCESRSRETTFLKMRYPSSAKACLYCSRSCGRARSRPGACPCWTNSLEEGDMDLLLSNCTLSDRSGWPVFYYSLHHGGHWGHGG